MTPNTQDTHITYIIDYTMLTYDPLTKDHYELPPVFEPNSPWIQARDASHHTLGKLH